jgi:hypothetical protein
MELSARTALWWSGWRFLLAVSHHRRRFDLLVPEPMALRWEPMSTASSTKGPPRRTESPGGTQYGSDGQGDQGVQHGGRTSVDHRVAGSEIRGATVRGGPCFTLAGVSGSVVVASTETAGGIVVVVSGGTVICTSETGGDVPLETGWFWSGHGLPAGRWMGPFTFSHDVVGGDALVGGEAVVVVGKICRVVVGPDPTQG